MDQSQTDVETDKSPVKLVPFPCLTVTIHCLALKLNFISFGPKNIKTMEFPAELVAQIEKAFLFDYVDQKIFLCPSRMRTR